MFAFPFVIVRYERGSYDGATILFYARSSEQASDVLYALVTQQERYDSTAIYAIRQTAECGAFPSIYPCACGGTVGGR